MAISKWHDKHDGDREKLKKNETVSSEKIPFNINRLRLPVN